MKPVQPLNRPLFSLGEACKLAFVDPRRVTVWYQRGTITLGERVGPKKRLLSTWEVLQLALIGRLGLHGSVERAADWAASAVEQLRLLRPLEVASLEDLTAGLERSGDFPGLFLFPQRDNLEFKPIVQGTKHTLTVLHSKMSQGIAAPAPATFSYVPISQLLYGIVEQASAGLGVIEAEN